MLSEFSNNLKNEKGQMALVTVVTILAAGVVLVVALGILTFNEIKKINNVEKSLQSYYAAEAGVEDSLLRIRNNMNYPNPGSYTLSVGQGSTTVDISGPLVNLTITSKGDVNKRFRKLAVNLVATPSSSGASFNFAVQVGEGGLVMANNSGINGNVYVNAGILAQNSAFVTGGATAVTTIDNLDITDDGWANTIDNSTVGGIKYCQNTNDSPACDTSKGADPTIEPFPLTAAEIAQWKADAAAGGTCGPPKCDSSGDYVLSIGESDSLGPIKIDGDFLMDNTAILTVTGAIWVTGNTDFKNGSTTQLHSSFGSDSGVIVSDADKIIVDNGASIQGTSDPESFLMILSDKNSLSDVVLELSNDSSGAIYYAATGRILVKNFAVGAAIYGYGVDLDNDATITYVTGLANPNFSSGPGGTFVINSWQEVQ